MSEAVVRNDKIKKVKFGTTDMMTSEVSCHAIVRLT